MTVRHPARLALLALLVASTAIASVACSGGGGDGGPTTIPTTATPVCTPITDTSFHNLQAVIFTPNCALASCHAAGAGNPVGKPLDMSNAASTYANTVGVSAIETYNGGSIEIVNTAGHLASYMYKKLTNDPGIAPTDMPPGQLLCQSKIDAISAWIDAKAPND